MTTIFVDGDACPVREEIYRVAGRHGLKVAVVHNGSRPFRPPNLAHVQVVLVPDGADAADDWIAERIGWGDICVTADIPLARRCLGRSARALGNTGHPWTGNNIGAALAGREVARHLREIGADGGGHAPFGRAERSRFLGALDALIVAVGRDRARPPPGSPIPDPRW